MKSYIDVEVVIELRHYSATKMPWKKYLGSMKQLQYCNKNTFENPQTNEVNLRTVK